MNGGHIKRRWYCRPIVKCAVLGVTLTMFLAGVYVADTILSSGRHSAAQQPADSSAPLLACTASDASFCTTERSFREFVDAGDFSDILELQDVSTVACGKTQARSYCTSTQAGLNIRLLAVTVNGATKLVMRNDYITYFRAYAAANGPLTYDATTSDGDNVTMHFHGAHGAYLNLLFRKIDGSWHFAVPSTGARPAAL